MNRILAGVGIAFAAIGLITLIIFGIKNFSGDMDAKPIEALIKEGKLDEARISVDQIAEKKPGANALGKLYFDVAGAYEAKNDIVKAREIYQLILKKYQNIESISKVQDALGRLNIAILFSKTITDKDTLYEVEPGDTLINIAKKFGSTVDLIKTANSLRNDNIQARSKLKISKAKYKILVDKSQNILTLLGDSDIVKVYRVSTGENNSTPAGNFKIVNKITDPVWYTEKAIVPAESPENVLGSRWMGFNLPGYGIHGTTSPEKIGQQATKGCVRMLNSEVEELYKIIPVGTEVIITD
ncbi:MAG: L,D-transpeptidase family protein [Candidatus Omnitrophota bacterium]|nr:L,D-transpeptidase family protein [Candidatus Omnitrophota bacterium]